LWTDPPKLDQALLSRDYPKSVVEAYDGIITRIKNLKNAEIDLALRVCFWVFHSSEVGARSLQTNELLHLLCANEGDEIIRDKYQYRHKDVYKACQGLLASSSESDLEQVRFCHRSVQDYFRKYPQPPLVSTLAKICLNYLSAYVSGQSWEDSAAIETWRQKYKAGRYVGEFWTSYVKAAEDNVDVQDAVLAFLGDETKLNLLMRMDAYDVSGSDDGYDSFAEDRTPLQVLAMKGLAKICQRVVTVKSLEDDSYPSMHIQC
jgi:hypothetical protein